MIEIWRIVFTRRISYKLIVNINVSKMAFAQEIQVRLNREGGIYGTQRFVSGNICSEGLNRLRYSDLIAVKTRGFFGEKPPQTFFTRGLINSYFSEENMSFKV